MQDRSLISHDSISSIPKNFLLKNNLSTAFKPINDRESKVLDSLKNEIYSLQTCISGFKELLWLYSDTLDHVLSMMTLSSQSELILSRTHSNFIGSISLSLGTSSEKVGNVGNILTLVTAASTPFAIVSGLFGMNVKVPGGDLENYYMFTGIVLLCLVIGVFLVLILRKLL
ncbi:hypothetical protein BB560_000229 [Smittium megazygosporum]|uniref:Magnesium transporter n=1 Tax=Smittium megazygosporum TaxID=133381 RepID=A0A2T9ZL31_9FUNG|nr:hypothetical protein BB560_000229 [Smittium megazygosporum]